MSYILVRSTPPEWRWFKSSTREAKDAHNRLIIVSSQSWRNSVEGDHREVRSKVDHGEIRSKIDPGGVRSKVDEVAPYSLWTCRSTPVQLCTEWGRPCIAGGARYTYLGPDISGDGWGG